MPAPKPMLRRRIGGKSFSRHNDVVQHTQAEHPTHASVHEQRNTFVMTTPKVLHVKGAFVLIIVLLLILGGVGYYFFFHQKSPMRFQNSNAQEGSSEVTDVVKEVGKLIDLPQGEQPTLATVSDATKLQGQSFFAKAQNGDKVLIYTNAKKAFLYRPSTRKLIEVGPVAIPTPQPTTDVQGVASPSGTLTPSPSGVATEEIQIALYNGSGVTGVTRSAESKLTASSKDISITLRENAQTRDYTETLVVDLTGQKKDAQAVILKALGIGKVGSLPAGETRPAGADFLIILGTDFTSE